MKYIGAHVSIGGGFFNVQLRAKEIGAKAFVCFTKNQKRWQSKPYHTDDVVKFKANLEISGILSCHVLAHSHYQFEIKK